MNKENRMLQKQFILDKTAIWASMLCAVHCVGIPLIMSVSTFGSLALLDDYRIEAVVLVFSVAIGITSLIPSYMKHHRNALPIAIFILGFTLIACGRLSANESIYTAIGAALVATAHYSNFKLCKRWHEQNQQP